MPPCVLSRSGHHRDLHSFPTRRSSDLLTNSIESSATNCFWFEADDIGDERTFMAEERTEKSRALDRSEEHTSELQSHVNLVCRLLLEKKKRSAVVQTTVVHTRQPAYVQ